MGWIAIAFICILVILIVVFKRFYRKDGEKGKRKSNVAIYPIRIPSKNKEIHRLLELAYATKQRITIQYETGNPLPGEPAIKTRDIDIYGIGDEYLEAYCHYRGQIRIFKISRLLSVRLSGDTYKIPCAYTTSTWVTEGWGDLSDTRLESMEVVHAKDTRSYVPEDTEDKDERTKRERISKKAASHGRGEITRTHVRYDWQKRWKESLRTIFPDEWSPALPYLYEANRLEREGANQEKIQEVLDQARKADSNATSFYITRWSIIKEMQNRNHK
jgi:hypothetical protein